VNLRDIFRYSFNSIGRSAGRTSLMLLAMAIGVAAVILLTGLGEAARRYVTNEFVSLGTNLVIVMPGKSETAGGSINASFTGSTRALTIDDAIATTRHASIAGVAPLVVGAAAVQYSGLEREVAVYGATSDMLSIRKWRMAEGQFLPESDWTLATSVCVIGRTISEELFANSSPIGQWLRVGENRFRVIGVLGNTGTSMGMNTDEVVIVPVASAMTLFNTDGLFRVLVEAKSRESIDSVRSFVSSTIKARHHGEEDVTVITQDAVLATFDDIFNVLTFAVAGIAAISLAVAGVLIMNVMLVAVSQRTAEVGLLKAVGAAPRQILAFFVAEAALLSLFGSLIGLVVGLAGSWLASRYFPSIDMRPPVWAIFAGVSVAIATGILFGIMPAQRAAKLDPVEALAKGK